MRRRCQSCCLIPQASQPLLKEEIYEMARIDCIVLARYEVLLISRRENADSPTSRTGTSRYFVGIA